MTGKRSKNSNIRKNQVGKNKLRLMKARRSTLKKVRHLIKTKTKPKFREMVSSKIIKEAVDKALSGLNPCFLVFAKKHSDIMCEKCGECCRINDPVFVDLEDIMNIANFLDFSYDLVVAVYTKQLNDGRLSLQTPCPFLHNNLCSIYAARPKVCRVFPFTVHEGKITLSVYSYCSFTINLMAYMALGFIMNYLYLKKHPEMKEVIEKQGKILERALRGLDQLQQIEFVHSLYKKSIKKK